MRYLRPLLTIVAIVFTASVASATPITIVGNSTGNLSTATGELTLTATTLTLQLKNTSPPDARITGLGFDLIDGDFTTPGSSGLNGFTGANVGNFIFTDGAVGGVNQFNGSVLDFAFLTGPNFNGGSANDGLVTGNFLTFIVSGNFAGLTEAQVAHALFVRFQRVGPGGGDSDVGRGDIPDVAEPASMLLLGTGLVVAAARRRLATRS